MDSSGSKEVMGDSSLRKKRGAEDVTLEKRSSAKVRFDETADSLEKLVEAKLKSSSDGAAYRKTIADLELKVKNLKAEIYDAREKLEESRGKSAKGESKCTNCTANAVALEVMTNKYQKLKAYWKREKDEQEVAVEATEKELAEHKSKLAQTCAEKEDIEGELASVRSQLTTVMLESAELKHQHDSLHSISPERYRQLEQEKAALEEALHKAEAATKQALAEKASAVALYEQTKKWNIEIAGEDKDRKAKKAALLEEVDALKAQLAAQAVAYKAQLREEAVKYGLAEKMLLGSIAGLELSVAGTTAQLKEMDVLKTQLETQAAACELVKKALMGKIAALESSLVEAVEEGSELKAVLARELNKPRDASTAVVANSNVSMSSADVVPAAPVSATDHIIGLNGNSTAAASTFTIPHNNSTAITATTAAVVEPSDDFSVLSDNTDPTKMVLSTSERAVLLSPAVPQHSVVFQDHHDHEDYEQHPSLEELSKKCLLISRVPPSTPAHQIQALALQYGQTVYFETLTDSSYFVQYAEVHEAHNALHHLSNRRVDGVMVTCEHAPRSVVAARAVDRNNIPDGTTVSAEYYAAKDRESNRDKHLRCVFVLHHAPAARRRSAEDIEWTLRKFGRLRYFRAVQDSEAYIAEFVEKVSADNALKNFPLHFNDFKISCESRFDRLPKSTVPIPADTHDDRDQDTARNSARRDVKPRVVLVDPALKANRAKTGGEKSKGASKPFCTYCKSEQDGANNPYTHTIDNCRIIQRDGANKGVTGGARLNMGYEKKRARSESRDRAGREVAAKRTSTGGTGASTSGRELGPTKAREVKTEEHSVVSGDGITGECTNSAREGGASTFDAVTGVRPLSAAR